MSRKQNPYVDQHTTQISVCLSNLVQVNELVQVETYLRSEGVLVRYWYPIEMLERPPAGSRRTAANGLVSLDSSNIQIHRCDPNEKIT